MPDKSNQVFLIKGEKLFPMPEMPLRKGLFGKTLEDALQTLIARHPEVIPGGMIGPESDDPHRFVLLRREMPVGGWSLDLLLVDQRGVLTLVEAKLIKNPESRRDVIGQIMEYAANAVERWADGQARTAASEFWAKQNEDIDEIMRRFLGEGVDLEGFWALVEENLKGGRIRLIIAGDSIRPEVRRIIEYLNAEMTNAEIYGLELQCYGTDQDSLVLVPRLIGQTQAVLDRKSRMSAPTVWTENKVRDYIEELSDDLLAVRYGQMFELALEKGIFVNRVGLYPGFNISGTDGKVLFGFWANGYFDIYMNEDRFNGGAVERDGFVADLKSIGLLDEGLDPNGVVANKKALRAVTDLNEDEFSKFLDIVNRYSAA